MSPQQKLDALHWQWQLRLRTVEERREELERHPSILAAQRLDAALELEEFSRNQYLNFST